MKIALLAYDHVSPFMLSTPLAVFEGAALAAPHDVIVCASNRRALGPGGLSFNLSADLDAASDADLVLLPGWCDAQEPVTDELVEVLRRAAQRGAVVVGLCLGTFGLAQAGLLDGRRATTHWAEAARFAARFPAVDVDAGALFIDEGSVVTSAGVAAGLDCCLHLVARFCGQAEANRIARQLVVAPQRSGAHAQLPERPAPVSLAEHRVADLLEALWHDPRDTPSLDALAKRAGVSTRSLTRHIRTRTGDSLAGWLRRARIARAQELLARGSPIELAAVQCGFADGQAMRQAFQREHGMSPRQWAAKQRLDYRL
ncbi:helix-turn-helix domain-containing protein [Pseudomonas sp. RP23018S]|uniref:GlxA family transcriptional regulator n=1 Tax=Pseudomonas sp. RP23018S TaxID=3096037 RepID=UPI002AC9F3EC|nr:helix-turn-helix domain-containing protein [Pseudomonas sp. RP23018S]MDZ5602240.1 helix-turn-helix domain-containing protein [Pseudomonas sp. RP23018S]